MVPGPCADLLRRHGGGLFGPWSTGGRFVTCGASGFAPVAGMTKEGKNTPLYAVAIVLVLIGMFAFFAVLLRLV